MDSLSFCQIRWFIFLKKVMRCSRHRHLAYLFLLLLLVGKPSLSSSLAFGGNHRSMMPAWSSPLRSVFFSTIPELVNSTIGHPDGMLSLGIHPSRDRENLDGKESDGEIDADDDINIGGDEDESDNSDAAVQRRQAAEEARREATEVIKATEIELALETAQRIASLTDEEIISQENWNLVHRGEVFSLFKRRQGTRENGQPGPVEYLMVGTFEDVSPVTFLRGQIDKGIREMWDKTMMAMSGGEIEVARTNAPSPFAESATESDGEINADLDADVGTEERIGEGTQQDGTVLEKRRKEKKRRDLTSLSMSDVLYYRTKWPWPLKDRDYVLARRCRIYDEEGAIVLVSKSKQQTAEEAATYPLESGVIRVDNYWCHSAFISTKPRIPAPALTPTPESDPAPAPPVTPTPTPVTSQQETPSLSSSSSSRHASKTTTRYPPPSTTPLQESSSSIASDPLEASVVRSSLGRGEQELSSNSENANSGTLGANAVTMWGRGLSLGGNFQNSGQPADMRLLRDDGKQNTGGESSGSIDGDSQQTADTDMSRRNRARLTAGYFSPSLGLFLSAEEKAKTGQRLAAPRGGGSFKSIGQSFRGRFSTSTPPSSTFTSTSSSSSSSSSPSSIRSSNSALNENATGKEAVVVDGGVQAAMPGQESKRARRTWRSWIGQYIAAPGGGGGGSTAAGSRGSGLFHRRAGAHTVALEDCWGHGEPFLIDSPDGGKRATYQQGSTFEEDDDRLPSSRDGRSVERRKGGKDAARTMLRQHAYRKLDQISASSLKQEKDAREQQQERGKGRKAARGWENGWYSVSQELWHCDPPADPTPPDSGETAAPAAAVGVVSKNPAFSVKRPLNADRRAAAVSALSALFPDKGEFNQAVRLRIKRSMRERVRREEELRQQRQLEWLYPAIFVPPTPPASSSSSSMDPVSAGKDPSSPDFNPALEPVASSASKPQQSALQSFYVLRGRPTSAVRTSLSSLRSPFSPAPSSPSASSFSSTGGGGGTNNMGRSRLRLTYDNTQRSPPITSLLGASLRLPMSVGKGIIGGLVKAIQSGPRAIASSMKIPGFYGTAFDSITPPVLPAAVRGVAGTAAEGIGTLQQQQQQQQQQGVKSDGGVQDSVGAEISDITEIPAEQNGIKKTRAVLQPTDQLLQPGMKFITVFCDDQKVPLHPKIVDILSSQGEKLVPESIEKLRTVVREIQRQGDSSHQEQQQQKHLLLPSVEP